MRHAQYIGPREELRGNTALIRPSLYENEVLAQFDFPAGTEFDAKGAPLGSLEPIKHRTSRDIVPSFPDEHPECFGWHIFPAEHFLDTDLITAGAVVAI